MKLTVYIFWVNSPCKLNNCLYAYVFAAVNTGGYGNAFSVVSAEDHCFGVVKPCSRNINKLLNFLACVQ